MMKLQQSFVHEAQDFPHFNGTDSFRPNRLVRWNTVQTFASGYPLPQIGTSLPGEQVVVLDGGEDETGYDDVVRLVGYYNRRTTQDVCKGLVISLHGWEGCSHSTHNLTLGKRLLAEGYDFFRLNLRDHGPGYHVDAHALNQGLFLGTLLAEVHHAVQRVASWANSTPVYLVGPSMGGNFVLRMAMRHAAHPITNLARVIAVNPAINPQRTTDRIDANFVFRQYFRRRWLNSLMAKARLFPQLYELDSLVNMSHLRAMTEWLAPRFSPYSDADDYFSRYAVMGDALVGVSVPTTILTAADDPVVAVEDIEALTPTPLLERKIERFGGHVGFVDVWPLHHLLPEMVLRELRRS